MKPPYIIAEIGCNHQGQASIAHEMIDAAANAGVDAVKFQLRDVWDTYPKEWADKVYNGPHSFGRTYLEHRRALELTKPEYRDIVDHAVGRGLAVGASVWDVASIRTFWDCEFDFLKIPSAMLTSQPLLDQAEWLATNKGTEVILSTGMSTADEVMEPVENRAWPPGALTVLHCTSSYPCENSDVHLRAMSFIKQWLHVFLGLDIRVGISGHWRGIQIDAAATALGAQVIERHFTLDRTMKGTDHAVSLEPGGLAKLCRDVRVVAEAMGESSIQVLPCEEEAKRKLRHG